MKKILAIILALTLLLSLCSCNFSDKDLTEELGKLNDIVSNLNEGIINLDITEDVVSKIQEIIPSVSRGVIEGNVYKSKFSGITFTKPDSWVYSTDEEIAAAMNMGAEMLNQGEFEKTMAQVKSVYDMRAISATTGANISVQYENLALSLMSSMTEEQYIDAFIGIINDQEGVEIKNDVKSSIKLGDKEYTKVEYVLSMSGVEVNQAVYVRKIGNYMNSIIVTLVTETVEEIEAMFS